MRFEDLHAWQESRSLVNAIYKLTSTDSLKKDFGLCSQLQRAGVSIMANLAEGFERLNFKEKAQYYNIAKASSGEVRCLLYVVKDNYLFDEGLISDLFEQVDRIGRLITGLMLSTKKRILKTKS